MDITLTADGTLTDPNLPAAVPIRVLTSAPRTVRGINTATSSPLFPIKVVTNASSFELSFTNDDASASAADRTLTPDGATLVLRPSESLHLGYDYNVSGGVGRWRVTQVSPNTSAGLLVSELSTLQSHQINEVRLTIGFDRVDDGGGGLWFSIASGTSIADGWSVIDGPNCQWKRQLEGDRVNACWLGCKDDGSVDTHTPVVALSTQWKNERGINASLVVYFPNARARVHSVTLNSTNIVQVATKVGLHVGQSITGAGIPADTRITAIDGTLNEITISTAATQSGARLVRAGAWGYALDSGPLPNDDQLDTHYIGESIPRINSFDYMSSSATADRMGPILVCATDVSGVSRHPDAATYPFLHIEKLGFVGPGAQLTSGYGVDTWYVNSRLTLEHVHCAGFKVGLYHRGGVTHHALRNIVAYGCEWGIKCGDISTPTYVIDAEFYSIDCQYNRHALTIENGHNLKFLGGILQGNRDGLIIGSPVGGFDVGNIQVDLNHWENNGDEPVAYPAGYYVSDPGGRHVTIHSGGSLNLLQIRNAIFSGDGLTGPSDHTFSGSSNVSTTAVLTGVTSPSALYVGQYVATDPYHSSLGGACAAHNSRIVSIVSGTVTLDKNLLVTGAGKLIGITGGTIHVPDSAVLEMHACLGGALVVGTQYGAYVKLENVTRQTSFQKYYFNAYSTFSVPWNISWEGYFGNVNGTLAAWDVITTGNRRSVGISGGNLTIDTITGLPSGETCYLMLINVDGGRTVSLGGNIYEPTGGVGNANNAAGTYRVMGFMRYGNNIHTVIDTGWGQL